MSRRWVISLACALLCTGCGPLNPYVRAGSTMLHHYHQTFRWAAVGAPENEGSCQDERLAAASLSQCVDQLSGHVGLRTTREVADHDLVDCMRSSGWQRIWISGVTIFG